MAINDNSGFDWYDRATYVPPVELPPPTVKAPAVATSTESDATGADPYLSAVNAVYGPPAEKPKAEVPKNIRIPINIPLPWKRGGNRSRLKPGLFLSGSRLQGALKGMQDYIKESDYKPNTPGTSFLSGLASGYIGAKGDKAALREKDLAERKKAWEEDQKNRSEFLQKLREAQISKSDKETPGWTKVTIDNIDDINAQLEATGHKKIGVDKNGNPTAGYVKTDDIYTDVSKGDSSGIYVLKTPQEIANFKKVHPELANKMYVEADGSVRVPVATAYREPQPVLSPGALQFGADYALATGQPLPGLQRSPRMVSQIYEALNKRGINGQAIALAQANFRARSNSLTHLQRMAANSDAFINTAHANSEILLTALNKIRDNDIMLVNNVLRGVGRLAGDPDIAAFNTALEILRPEFSRILNSPNMTGSTTVSQKAEINAVLSGNFSKSQMRAALNVLNQDASNRSMMYSLALESMRNDIANGAQVPIQSINPEMDFIPANDTSEPGIWHRQHPGQTPGVPAQTGGSGSSNLQGMLGGSKP